MRINDTIDLIEYKVNEHNYCTIVSPCLSLSVILLIAGFGVFHGFVFMQTVSVCASVAQGMLAAGYVLNVSAISWAQ